MRKQLLVDRFVKQFSDRFYKKFGTRPIIKYPVGDSLPNLLTLDNILNVVISKIPEGNSYEEKYSLLTTGRPRGYLGDLKKIFCKVAHDHGFIGSKVANKVKLGRAAGIHNRTKAGEYLEIGYPEITKLYNEISQELETKYIGEAEFKEESGEV